MIAPTLDDEIRAAALAKVQQLRELYGGRIPNSALMPGITVRGERVPIWNPQQGIFKPAVLGREGAALTVQTSAKSPYADVHDAEAGYFVYKYRGTNPQHHDNVALRRALLERRPIIYLVAVDPGVYDAVLPVYVTGDEPDRLQFTLVADQIHAGLATNAELIDRAAADPLVAIRREYITRGVMQRLHQQRFRRVVLGAYRERCAICRLGHRELLDAAHILPDRDPRGEPVVSNGLGLCKIHHSAYDVHIIGIDPDAKVHVRKDILVEIDGPMLQHGLQGVHGQWLGLPRRDEHRPNRDYLAERFERFRAA